MFDLMAVFMASSFALGISVASLESVNVSDVDMTSDQPLARESEYCSVSVSLTSTFTTVGLNVSPFISAFGSTLMVIPSVSEGKKVYIEGMTAKSGNEFNAHIQVSAERRGIDFIFENDRIFTKAGYATTATTYHACQHPGTRTRSRDPSTASQRATSTRNGAEC